LTFLNIIWLIFGGFLSGLGHILRGVTLCLTIIGIPFGIQHIKIGWSTFTPFGKKVIELENANSTLRLVLNVLWISCFGLTMAIGHLVFATLLGITIIGLPFAKQHIKLIPLSLLPFGRTLQ
jgi:uncharacterized membrane protein YccF (DUF307 family)